MSVYAVQWRKPLVPGDVLVMEMHVTNFKKRFGICKVSRRFLPPTPQGEIGFLCLGEEPPRNIRSRFRLFAPLGAFRALHERYR